MSLSSGDVVEALAKLRARSCIIDGEAVVCRDDGLTVFDLVRHWANGGSAFLYAFDLIELDGDDLRPEPLEKRKAKLARLLVRVRSGVRLNEHLEADGSLVFEQACRMGLEGMVSKRKGSPYRSGRSQHWVKAKNPNSPAVARLAEKSGGDDCAPTGLTLRSVFVRDQGVLRN